jgi:hypothetical protein
MSRKRYRPEEIIAKLREADVPLSREAGSATVPTPPTGSPGKGPSLGPFQHWYAVVDYFRTPSEGRPAG